jgi:hypothetical protein
MACRPSSRKACASSRPPSSSASASPTTATTRPVGAGHVPDVPGRGRGRAEARTGVRHGRRRRAGHLHGERSREDGARGHARVLPAEPPARLPDLRQVRRVQAAGLHARRGPQARPLLRAQAGPRPGRLRRRHPLRRRPLHHVHALRALHARGRAGRPALRGAARPPLRHRHVLRPRVEGTPSTGNIVDICPVGALLSKDFLHKARVWDLDNNASICPSCSQGCNIELDTRDNLVMRLRPRPNPDVNGTGCATTAGSTTSGSTTPTGSRRRSCATTAAGSRRWQQALLALVERLKAARGGRARGRLALPRQRGQRALLRRLGEVLGGGERVPLGACRRRGRLPGLPEAGPAPGPRGQRARARGCSASSASATTTAQGGLDDAGGATSADRHGRRAGGPAGVVRRRRLALPGARPLALGRGEDAHFVLPVTTFAEQEGTFTNFEGRVQRFWPALQAPPLARPRGRCSACCSPASATARRRPMRPARSCAGGDLHDAFAA